MSFFGWFPARHIAFLGAATLMACGTAQAQLAPTDSSRESDAAATEFSGTQSSSNDYLAMIDLTSADPGAPGAPSGGKGGGPYDNRSRGPSYSRWTFEFGAGFNAPIGND